MRPTFLLTLGFVLALAAGSWAGDAVEPAPNGITIPAGFPDWAVISASHRLDNKSMRITLGNDIAIKAARAGQTNPWPDGAILAKVVWKEKPMEGWPEAITPGELVHAEFMIKDSRKYEANGTGWGWARWLGHELKPFGKDASFEGDCIRCHAQAKDKDWAFTVPAAMPRAALP